MVLSEATACNPSRKSLFCDGANFERRTATLIGSFATAVFANFKQVVKGKPVRIHPIAGQIVDPAVLENMKARPGDWI